MFINLILGGLTNESNDFLQLCVLDSAVQADMRNDEPPK